MIYLFEDRKGRMKQYLKEDIDCEIVQESTINCSKEELNDYLETNYSNADLILFHKSYTFPQKNITCENIKAFFIKKNVPFVYFSGGLDNSIVVENGIINGNVNSGDMYANLSAFLLNFNKTKRFNIPILIYGKNYLINSLLELQNKLSCFLFNENDKELTKDEIDDLIDSYINPYIREPELDEDKNRLLEWLKRNDGSAKSGITISILLNQIQKMIDKY